MEAEASGCRAVVEEAEPDQSAHPTKRVVDGGNIASSFLLSCPNLLFCHRLPLLVVSERADLER